VRLIVYPQRCSRIDAETLVLQRQRYSTTLTHPQLTSSSKENPRGGASCGCSTGVEFRRMSVEPKRNLWHRWHNSTLSNILDPRTLCATKRPVSCRFHVLELFCGGSHHFSVSVPHKKHSLLLGSCTALVTTECPLCYAIPGEKPLWFSQPQLQV
jgi:hypothetical protein